VHVEPPPQAVALQMAWRLNFVTKDDVEKDREVVAGASGDYEDVPNRVAESKAASGEECDADGIKEAAREEPVDAVRRDGGKQWLYRNQGDPTHCEV